MKIARPTIAEERWLALAARYPALRADIEQTSNGGLWKTTTELGRVLGFLLGLLATGLLAGVLSLFPEPLLVGGLLLVVAAEWLVAQRRVYRSGIEEALYLCGAVAIVLQLLKWSHGSDTAIGVALIATAVLLVGWRLLNPLFTTLALAGYSLALAMANKRFAGGDVELLVAAVFCAALAVAALLAGGRSWRRPAHDHMCSGLIIVMPWCAYAWLSAYLWRGHAANDWITLFVALAFVAVNITVGVKRRVHAPLISALGSIACVAFSLERLLQWSMHWKLIVAGLALLAVAIVLERMLRREQGITSAAVDEHAGLDLVQLAAAAHLAPAPGAAPAGFQGQGGGFGGGGASGQF